VIAVAGGFVAPAVIFAAINWGDHETLRGWAIPSATDIAFVVAVLSMLGRAVPPALRTFLLALAIIDDLMAIVVIAMFYTSELSALSLLLGALGVVALIALNVCDVRARAAYVLVGIFTWVCVLKSGVHATLAGVAVGLAMPHGDREGESMLDQTEHALRPWVSFAIVPAFAFANAGVSLAGVTLTSLFAPIPLGVAAGLFVGKQIGVLVPSLLAIRTGLVERPKGVDFAQLYGRHSHRHRLHHEPFHRHPRLRGRERDDASAARRPGRLAVGRPRRLGAAVRGSTQAKSLEHDSDENLGSFCNFPRTVQCSRESRKKTPCKVGLRGLARMAILRCCGELVLSLTEAENGVQNVVALTRSPSATDPNSKILNFIDYLASFCQKRSPILL
jgi:hypothetical protein